MPSAEQSECVVESIDKIDGVVPCSFSVRGNLPRKVRALDRDRGDKPGGQSSQRKKGNSENKSHGFRTAERPARHSRHQRVEQISKNHGDGYGDLAIGIPGEDIAGNTNNGAVYLLIGSSDLDKPQVANPAPERPAAGGSN